jgi:NADPH:quinone reductase-like Zn-dependent oxidoreductase
MATNTAAWLDAAKAYPFNVKESTLGAPGENQVLIKNRALAMNPIDAKLQKLAVYPIPYPAILGEDIAGEVVEVGPSVTRFKKGDRVLATASAFSTGRSEEAGFQAYTVVSVDTTTEIPDDMSFETAVVLPLCISTASSALFLPEWLGLQLPTFPAQDSTGKVVLVWGGASSVGCNAIQLLRHAGYEVIATASPGNFDLVKKLGAAHVFDYKSPTVIADILGALAGREVGGVLDAVGKDAYQHCFELADKSQGAKRVATVFPGELNPPEGVYAKKIYAPALNSTPSAKAVFEEFLPQALKSGAYVPAPTPFVFGKGLESIQGAIDHLFKGVSAQKVVVSL